MLNELLRTNIYICCLYFCTYLTTKNIQTIICYVYNLILWSSSKHNFVCHWLQFSTNHSEQWAVRAVRGVPPRHWYQACLISCATNASVQMEMSEFIWHLLWTRHLMRPVGLQRRYSQPGHDECLSLKTWLSFISQVVLTCLNMNYFRLNLYSIIVISVLDIIYGQLYKCAG